MHALLNNLFRYIKIGLLIIVEFKYDHIIYSYCWVADPKVHSFRFLSYVRDMRLRSNCCCNYMNKLHMSIHHLWCCFRKVLDIKCEVLLWYLFWCLYILVLFHMLLLWCQLSNGGWTYVTLGMFDGYEIYCVHVFKFKFWRKILQGLNCGKINVVSR